MPAYSVARSGVGIGAVEARFAVDDLRCPEDSSVRYETKLGIDSQFVPHYLVTGKTFLTNNS
jgi:hypothetical protein